MRPVLTALLCLLALPVGAQSYCADNVAYWPKPAEGCGSALEVGTAGRCEPGKQWLIADACWRIGGTWFGLKPTGMLLAPPPAAHRLPAETPPLAAVTPTAAPPANQSGLQGQWNVEAPAKPDYMAILLIDAQKRAVWESTTPPTISTVGYVKEVTATHATILLTDREDVARLQCSIQSSELMHCYSFLANGGISIQFKLTRVGPGPARITQAPR